MDDDIVLGMLEDMDAKIEDLKSDITTLRNEIDDLKSSPVKSGRSSSVEGTSDIEQKWRGIAVTFFEDQERALKDHKEAVKSDINGIQAHVNKLEANIVDMRKQIE